MLSGEAIRNIVGIFGNIISFGYFLSPVPTFWRIIKNKSVEEFQPYPYIATVMNCMLWVFYGLPVVHPNSILVSTINGVGLGLEFIYLIIFFLYCSKGQRKQVSLWLLVEMTAMTIVVLTTVFALHTTFHKTTFVGIISTIFSIIMYASPALVMKKVLQTKSVEYMPFWLSCVGFTNAGIWTAYSLIHTLDLYVLICNGLGTLCGVIQLIVYAMYRKIPKAEESEISGSNKV